MQLAKNLYLERGKNLSRKLQEAVLTQYLEQELTKEQILELYFNVVEFGPMIYGVGPAARHYFDAMAAGNFPSDKRSTLPPHHAEPEGPTLRRGWRGHRHVDAVSA